MTTHEPTLYDAVGGEPVFRRLVDIFYTKVEQDLTLRAIFPEDLAPGKQWQFLFLSQYWGGPTDYSAIRGHPRLRMRHMPYAITPAARDAWVRCMLEAIDEVQIAEPYRSTMRAYFERGAAFMVNQADDGEQGA